jgi:hypothetical protein
MDGSPSLPQNSQELSCEFNSKALPPLHASFSRSRTGVSYVSRRRRKDFRVADGVAVRNVGGGEVCRGSWGDAPST